MMRLAGLFLLLSIVAGAARAAEDPKLAGAVQANLPEFLNFLALDNIAAQPADMQRNAAFLQQSLQKRGLKVQLLDNPAGRPAVFAETAGKAAKTLLFYIHFDGQPILPEQWSQASPFTPVVKQKSDQGGWQAVRRELLSAQPLDPELRIFARSAADDKAPIMMVLTALDLLKSEGKKPAFGIKLLLDAEEEIGSPSLGAMVAAHRDLFSADAMVVLDGPAHPTGRPTLVFGNRGTTQVTLTVYGPRNPLHSGHFGNYVPNPAFRLAALLASMKDDRGRVLVPGYYDGVQVTDQERAQLAETPDDEAALLRRVGVAHSEQVGSSYQEALQYPSLNIRGMASAAIGAKVANIIPSDAVAELDLRTTPERDGRVLFDLLRQHILGQNYHLVEGPPTDQDRARFDKLASLKLGDIEPAERMAIDSPIGRWAYRALSGGDGAPIRIRMMGGTVPTDVLVKALDLPFVLLPLVNADNNQHSFDENLRIGNLLSGTGQIVRLLTTPFP